MLCIKCCSNANAPAEVRRHIDMQSFAHDGVLREALSAYVATQVTMPFPGGQQHQPMDVGVVKGKQKQAEKARDKQRNPPITRGRGRAIPGARVRTPPAASSRVVQ